MLRFRCARNRCLLVLEEDEIGEARRGEARTTHGGTNLSFTLHSQTIFSSSISKGIFTSQVLKLWNSFSEYDKEEKDPHLDSRNKPFQVFSGYGNS